MVTMNDDGNVDAHFDTPQWAPTPGQYLVFYDGDVCVGGGVINARANEPSVITAPIAVSSEPLSSRQSRIV